MASPNYCSKKYEFISEPDDSFTCRICLQVARIPWQHGKCGMLFCEECLEKYGRIKACPHCRRAQPQYLEDNKSQREIKAFRVRCYNVGRGCKWEGTVATLDNHVTKVCLFTPIPCPNECKDECILKENLEKHLKNECPNREYQCKYCGKRDTFASILQEHDKICEKKTVPCPNKKCKETMERKKIKDHTKNCDYSIISCKYKIIGCDAKMERRDMREHEKEEKELHLQQSLDTVIQLKQTIKTLTKDYSEYLILSNVLKNGETKTTKISLSKNKEAIFFLATIRPGGYFLFLLTQKIDEILSITVTLRAIQHANPFTGTITVELLNQLADENHRKITLTPKEDDIDGNNDHHDDNADTNDGDDDDGCCWASGGGWIGYDAEIPLVELTSDIDNVKYLKDGSILFLRVSAESHEHKPWLECDVNSLKLEDEDTHWLADILQAD